MNSQDKSRFVYVTYIRTTPEKLWSALTEADFMRKYWYGMHIATDWKVGAPWKLLFTDGRVADDGEVLEFDPPRRMVLKWVNRWSPELTAEGEALCAIELEAGEQAVKLTVTHEIGHPDSELIVKVGGGWPRILSNLKSLLETGEVVLVGEWKRKE